MITRGSGSCTFISCSWSGNSAPTGQAASLAICTSCCDACSCDHCWQQCPPGGSTSGNSNCGSFPQRTSNCKQACGTALEKRATGQDLYIWSDAASVTIINSASVMDISGDSGGGTTKIVACTGENTPCTAVGHTCFAAFSPYVGVVCAIPCPTIYPTNAAEVQATGGWNVWSSSCRMSSTQAVSSGDTVKIKKDPSMSGELVIDRGATSGDYRHFDVDGGALEMNDVTLTGGYTIYVSFPLFFSLL